MEKFVAFVILGLLLVVLGIINCTGNISSIHWYNRRKVAPENILPYGRMMGGASILIGSSMLLTTLLEIVLKDPIVEIIIIPAAVIGLIMMFYAQFKYNKGLF